MEYTIKAKFDMEAMNVALDITRALFGGYGIPEHVESPDDFLHQIELAEETHKDDPMGISAPSLFAQDGLGGFVYVSRTGKSVASLLGNKLFISMTRLGVGLHAAAYASEGLGPVVFSFSTEEKHDIEVAAKLARLPHGVREEAESAFLDYVQHFRSPQPQPEEHGDSIDPELLAAFS